MSTAQERAGADKGASREIFAEIGAIYLVKLFVQTEVGAKNLDRNQVVHRHVSRGESGLHPVEEKPDLFFDVFRRLSSLGIDSDPARQIKRVARQHRVAEGQLILAGREHDVSNRAD